MIDVVVPAHDEESLIGACLRAVLADSAGLNLRVIVVANGCTDATAQRAKVESPAGHEVIVLELPTAGKAGALNAAEQYRRGCAVVYLDADTVLMPGTMAALAAALEDPAPRLMAPPLLPVRPTGMLARSYAAVWIRLPAVDGHPVGGCYAVTAAGRTRWSSFPEVTADDSYVRSRFAASEQRVLDAGGLLYVLPEGWELVSVVRRWRDGNTQLTDAPTVGTVRNLRAVAVRLSLWPHLPGYLAVLTAGRLRHPPRWARAARLRAVSVPAPPAPVVAPVATGRPVQNDADYVLLTEPGVEPSTLTVARLLTLASRFPDQGVYGTARHRPSAVRRCPPTGLALLKVELWRQAGQPSTPSELPRPLARRAMTLPAHAVESNACPAGELKAK